MTAAAHVELGVYLYSGSRFRADDDTLPVGGLAIDITDIGEDEPARYLLVNVYRGRVEYFTIDSTDAAYGSHLGHINPPVIRDVLKGIAGDIVRHGDPVRHVTAQTVLGGVLARHTPARTGH